MSASASGGKREPPVAPSEAGRDSESDQVSQNIAAVLEFYSREEQRISASQRLLERISNFIGRPAFLGSTLLFVLVWGLVNILLPRFGLAQFDPEPYHWLQGITGLCALLATGVVLGKQNRLDKLAEQRAHLDLKVMLLTEQKAAKLIELLEELRRDLPNVRNRDDSNAAALTQSMSPDLVLAALDERRDADVELTIVGETAENSRKDPQ